MLFSDGKITFTFFIFQVNFPVAKKQLQNSLHLIRDRLKNDRELELLWTHTYSELNCKKCLILSPSEAIDTAVSAIEQLGKLSCGMSVMWCGVVWCGVVWCGVVWCGVGWCGVVWCGVVWCGVVWCGVVWCGVVWCGVVWSGVVWCGVVWCGVYDWCVECGVLWYGVVWCVWCGVYCVVWFCYFVI